MIQRALLKHFIISTAILLAFLCAALIVLGVGISSIRRDNQIDDLSARTQLISQDISQELFRQLSLVRSLTYNEYIHAVLGGGEQGRADKVDAVLEFAKKDLNASIVYVMDTHGTVVASTAEPSLAGRNYAFRPYFTEALRGEAVIYPAVGVTTHERGIYMSMPVYRIATLEPVGVAVAKIPASVFDALSAGLRGPAFIATEEGIVFSTNKHEWLFRTVRELSDESKEVIQLSRQFADVTLNPLPFSMEGGSFSFANSHYYVSQTTIPTVRWQLYVCDPVLSRYPLTDVQRAVIVVGCSVFLVLLIIIWLLSSSIYQQKKSEEKLEASKQVLEDLVLRRSQELIGDVQDSAEKPIGKYGLFDWIRWHVSVPMVIVLCCGIVLSCMVFLFYHQYERRNHERQFRSFAYERLSAISRSLEYSEEQLKFLKACFYALPEVTRSEFKAFVTPLVHTSGAQCFAWLPRLSREQIDEYQERAQNDGLTRYEIRTVDHSKIDLAEIVYPIHYIEPQGLYEEYLGLDIASYRPVRILIDTIQKSEEMSVLWADGFLGDMYADKLAAVLPVPHYANGAPRSEELIGVIVSLIDVAQVFTGALENMVPGEFGYMLEFTGYDVPHEYVYIDHFDARFSYDAQQVRALMARQDAYYVSRSLSIGERDCVLTCFSLENFSEADSVLAEWIVLASGITFSLVLALFIGSLSGQRGRIKDAVATQTEALAKANQRLETEILDRKVIEEEMRRAKDAAESASHAKSDFLANMSHEIRTPMNAVIGFSNLLQDSGLTREQQEFVETISDSGKMLLTLIDDILDVSKIEANRIDIEEIDFDIENLVKSIVAIMSVKVDETRVRLEAQVPENMWRWYTGDPTRIRQVLLNLLSNAVKFTERGEIVVSVTPLGYDSKTGVETLSLSVRDTGIGISPEKQQHIFESFVQADSSVTRKFGGTGLGLTISRALVRRMGGDIAVISEEGHGSEFVATVSLVRAKKRVVQSGESDWSMLAGKRVVIVAEDMVSARILEAYCKDVDMRVLKMTASAEDGMNYCLRSDHQYDILFVDLMMPDIDGYAFVQKLALSNVLPHGRHAIAVSADTRIEIRRRARDVGFHGYLLKPVLKQDVYGEMAAIFRRGHGFVRLDHGSRVSAHTLQDVRVLVVEDNPVNMKLILAVLNGFGCVVDSAYNAQEAVEKVTATTFDVILMDIQMPDMDGYKLTELLRGTYGVRVPIIALTAAALKEDRDKALQVGMNEFVVKPIDAQLLKEKLVTVVFP